MNQYDYLKNKLQDYQVKADKDKIWRATAHAIPQRRRRVMLFLFCLGSLAGLGLLGYELSFPSSTPSLVSISNQKVNATPNEQHVISSAQAVIIAQPANQTTHEALIDNATASSTTITKTKNIISSQLGKPQKTKPSFPANTVAQPSKATSNVVTNELSIASQSTTNTPLHIDPAEPIDLNLIVKTNDAIDQQEAGHPGSLKMEQTSANDNPRSSIDATDALPNTENAIADALESLTVSNPGVPVIPVQRNRKPIVYSAMAAIGISTLDINALNSKAVEAATLFNQSVRSLEHLSVDVAGRLPLSNVFAVESQLGWNRWTIETQQQVTTREPISREGISEIIIDEEGIQHPVMGTVNGIQVTNTQMIRFTQFQTVAANISLHAELWRHHRTSIDAYLAGSVKIYDTAKGSAYNAEGVLTPFSKTENPFKLTSTFGYGGGLQLNYQISPHLRLAASLGYQPVSYHWQQDQQQIRLTHSRIRGNVGLNYQL